MNSNPPSTLLVVLAHPDDESFGIGGTLAKYASVGVRITLVCATRGQAGVPDMTAEEAGQLRQRELEAAVAVLGIAELRWLEYMDGKLNEADPEQAVSQLVAIMQKTLPQVVITFGADGISGHPDHIAIHRFATAAFDRAGLSGRLFYIAPSEATQQGCGARPAISASVGALIGVDISEFAVTKVRAMQCHVSQEPPFPGDPERKQKSWPAPSISPWRVRAATRWI